VSQNGVGTEIVNAALAGQAGTQVTEDTSGTSVLAAYRPIKVGAVTWVLVAEVDESEALAAVDRLLMIAGLLEFLLFAVSTLALSSTARLFIEGLFPAQRG
jgi:methyl-accepting chemotaxis protein